MATSIKRPISVLWLIKGLGPGGAEQLLVSSARVADHDAFHLEVAYIRPDKQQLVPALEAAGVETHLLPGAGMKTVRQLRRLMSEFDVVHAHSPLLAGFARLTSLTVPRRKRPRLVSTEHNMWGNFVWPTRVLNALTCWMDAQRWSVSSEVQRSMWGRLGEGAPVLIHGIVQGDHDRSQARSRESVRQELGVDQREVVAIIVANFRREKDYPNLLRATKQALTRFERLTVLVVGQGPLENEIKQLHNTLALGDNLRFLGYRKDVNDLLGASDFFVLASQHEGLPVSIMEAMAVGLPVVATSVGGVPEAVEDGVNGRLVAAGDSSALAVAMVEVAGSEELRARMGAAGRARSHRFDIRSAVEVQQRTYRRLASR